MLPLWSLGWVPGCFWEAWLGSDVAVLVLVDKVVVAPIWGFCCLVLLGVPVWAGGLLVVLLGGVVLEPGGIKGGPVSQVRGLQPSQ